MRLPEGSLRRIISARQTAGAPLALEVTCDRIRDRFADRRLGIRAGGSFAWKHECAVYRARP
jgi:hypothetical protein